MRYYLTRIQVEGFRGINNENMPLELRFKPEVVNSIFAVNGTGKSSIVEALLYAIRGRVPRLEQIQNLERPDQYVQNLFHTQRRATIELDFLPDSGGPTVTIRVERDHRGTRTVSSPTGHADPQGFLSALDEDFSILDASTFARFMEQTALDRGRSFSSLLGLSRYSDFRQALASVSDRRAINSDLRVGTLDSEVNTLAADITASLQRVESNYRSLVGRDIGDVSRVTDLAEDVRLALEGIELIRPLVQGRKLSEIQFPEIQALLERTEGSEDRRAVVGLIAEITRLGSYGDGEPEQYVAEFEALRQAIRDRDALLAGTPGLDHKRLCDAARTLLVGGSWPDDHVCPLCGSELTDRIEDVVERQLRQYSLVAEKNEAVRRMVSSSAWRERVALLEEDRSIVDGQRIASDLVRAATDGSFSLDLLDQAEEHLRELTRRRVERLTASSTKKDLLEKNLPPSLVALMAQVEHGRQFKDALVEHWRKSGTLAEKRRLLELCNQWRRFIADCTERYGAAEADLSRRLIATIGADYQSMFSAIMSAQDIVPSLQRSTDRERLYVQLDEFHGVSNVSARALLSESYRNALAIAIFLSAAGRHTGSARFVVLDDVTSSFDSGHQFALMEQIRIRLQQPANPNGLQFILFSHDGLLEKYFDKISNDADWHHVRLQGLPPVGAVRAANESPNRLRQTIAAFLSGGQVKEAEALVRQYLENQLLQIISKVQVPVPLDFVIKDSQQMVGNALDAIKSAVDLYAKAGLLVLEPAQVASLQNSHVPALVANWVTHYSTGVSASFTPAMLSGVVQSVESLADCFKYADGAGNRRWYRSLSQR
jgi:hypothetical protein